MNEHDALYDCPACNGIGYIKCKNSKLDGYSICEKCNSKGKLDWVELLCGVHNNLIGSEFYAQLEKLRQERFTLNLWRDFNEYTVPRM